MKFAILDARTHRSTHNARHSGDTYQYLDDLLDKTFLTDYFLVRSTAPAPAATPAPAAV